MPRRRVEERGMRHGMDGGSDDALVLLLTKPLHGPLLPFPLASGPFLSVPLVQNHLDARGSDGSRKLFL